MKSLWVLLSCGLVAASCNTEPVVSDTGYVGTWTRGNERVRSTISIYPDGESYLFRLSVDSDRAPGREVRCDWDGSCTELIAGEKARDYLFKTWVHPETEHLMVEYDVWTAKPRTLESHYVDELVLEAGGLALTAYTVERDGRKLERGAAPERSFKKVADRVASRPSSS